MTVWAGGLLAVLVLMTAAWGVSVVRHDASVVDRVRGPAFVLLAWVYAWLGDGWPPRVGLLLVLVHVWGIRLAVHVTVRNWGRGEDPRYARMREGDENFAVTSLFKVFWLQAGLAWVVSLPLLAVATAPSPTTFQWLDGIGSLVWLVGFVFEAGGDWQLSRFLGDPANRGAVLDRGLWRYTRHPNHFGDAVVWWGYALLGAATGAWWAVSGAVVMTFLLVAVSGVAATERAMTADGHRREGHADYVRRTNAFVPGPRKAP